MEPIVPDSTRAGIRRLAVFHDLPSGGAKRAVAAFLRELAARGIETRLFRLDSHGDAPPACDALAGGVEVLSLERPRLDRFPEQGALALANLAIDAASLGLEWQAMARQAGALERLAVRIDRSNFDAVLVNACALTYAPDLLHFLKTPSAYFCQEPPRRLHEPGWDALAERASDRRGAARLAHGLGRPLRFVRDAVRRRVDARATCAAGVVLANSEYSRAEIFRVYGVLAEVVRLGVDASLFAPAGERDRGLVLSPGRVHPLKGHELALEAVARIPRPRRPRLEVLGDQELRPFRLLLERRARELEVELDVRVGVSDTELARAYARAGAVLVLPVREPLGLVALEAMASEAPVVGVAEGGLLETIEDGVTGLHAARDAAQIAERLERLLSRPAEARALGAAARARVVSDWSWTRATERLLEVLERLRLDSNRAP